MRPIVTITLNPALDLATSVKAVIAGPKLRCTEPKRDPGGGGINVSRVADELGGKTTTFVVLGGATGNALEALLRGEGIEPAVFEIDGETRQSLSVSTSQTGEQYRFVMPGPLWTADTLDRALVQIRNVTPTGALVVFSGSLPPGVPDDFPARLGALLKDCDLIFDMSGAALERFASSQLNPFILRMDSGEGEMLHGGPLATAQDTARFARGLVDRKAAQAVIIARGAEGSVLATADGAWLVHAAKVPVDSKVGAGDSFVGAMAYALSQDMPLIEALQLGAAAASATVTTPATDLCSRAMIYDLLSQCTIEPLDA